MCAGAADGSQHTDAATIEYLHHLCDRPATNEAGHSSSLASVWADGWMLQGLCDFQQQDAACRECLRWVMAGVKSSTVHISTYSHKRKMLSGIFELLMVRDGLLYRQWQLPSTYPESVIKMCMPIMMHCQIMQCLLEGRILGHRGVNSTLLEVRQYFYWPVREAS